MFEDIIGKRQKLIIHAGGASWEGNKVVEKHKEFIIIDAIVYDDRPGWEELGKEIIPDTDPRYKIYEKAWLDENGELP
jgi:hypothetical protein